jgi:hypothetical protein
MPAQQQCDLPGRRKADVSRGFENKWVTTAGKNLLS